MFWGWIDTVKDNYPCVPPDFSSKCLQWELLEPAFGFLNKAVPKIANMFYAQAFNFRMGTKGLTTAEIYMVRHLLAAACTTTPAHRCLTAVMCCASPDGGEEGHEHQRHPHHRGGGLLEVPDDTLWQARSGRVHGVLRVCVPHVEGSRPLW